MMLDRDKTSLFKINQKRKALTEKKLLLQLEKEIKKMESQIKHPIINNPGIAFKRYGKMSLRTFQLIYPYLLFPMVSLTVLHFTLGYNPLKENYKKKYLRTKTSTDSFGDVSSESQYGSFKNNDDTIKYYNVWKDAGSGVFTRDVYVFNAEDYDYEEITGVFQNPNFSFIYDTFGKPEQEITEKSNNLTDEEKAKMPYVESVIYSTDKTDFIKDPVDTASVNGFLVLGEVLIGLIIYLLRLDLSSFDYHDEIRYIKDDHEFPDKIDIQRKLKIKKDNYDRLEGDE